MRANHLLLSKPCLLFKSPLFYLKYPKNLICYTAAALILTAPSIQAQNIAVINGTPISTKKMDAFLQELPIQKQNDPKIRDGLKQALIARQLIADEAQKQNLLLNPRIQMQVEDAKMQVLLSHVFKNYVQKKFSDADVKSFYMEQTGGGREFLARHILVKTEDEAKKILAAIQAGANFETLAKEKSLDTGSGKNGGLLNWAPASNYVPEFAKALSSMQKKQLLTQVIKTQFGFHIIKVDDMREKAMPPIKQLRDEILEGISQDPAWYQQLFEEMIQDLRKKAKIQ
jgi:peptidyl-prolyl cis-trans isomerase C